MQKHLNAKLIENLQPAPVRRYEVRDSLLPGFGVRVTTSGTKTWFVMSRLNGRQIRHKIGNYPIVSLAEAREAARKIIRDMQLGSYALEPLRSPDFFGQVRNDFIERYAKPKNRSWKSCQASLGKFFSLDTKPVGEVGRADIAKVLDGIVASGTPIAANRAMAAVKKLFSWALDRGLIATHPVLGMRAPGVERSRDRVLSDDEIRAFWAASETMGYPFGPAYQILLLTGQRRGEVTSMRWSDVNFEEEIWTIRATVAKNGRAHAVPLCGNVIGLLNRLPRFAGSDFVFTTTGHSPISGFGRAKVRAGAAMSVENWWVHDLRRTAASGMARLGVAPHVIEKILNHVSGQISGVAAVYNRHGYTNEKRKALEGWASHIHFLANGGGCELEAVRSG